MKATAEKSVLSMSGEMAAALRQFAAKYVWWKTPEEAMRFPERVAAQVMNIGEFDDAERLLTLGGTDYLRAVVQTAEAGSFTPPSWHYWHYKLGLADVDAVPPLPKREL